MKRRDFIIHATALTAMTTLGAFRKMSDGLQEQESLMPVFFIGHGSPMNGIESNEFSNRWKNLRHEIPLPNAILCISAHWLTHGTHITAMDHPQTIHDFGGFPKALQDVQYPAPGNPSLAIETARLIQKTEVHPNHDWGLDHGTWSVVRNIYPEANIPVLQLSIDYDKPASYHHELAGELMELRKKGVLVIGSGNMVHNLRMVDFSRLNENFGFDWTLEMNDIFKEKINQRDHKALWNYEGLGNAAKLAIPTPDHYLPLMYILGLRQQSEEAIFFNDKAVAGSLTMTSLRFG